MATTDIYHVVGGLQPARKAARFLGGNTDDYIQVNAAAAARVTANDTKGTISAWVMMPDITGTYTVVGAGDANAVEFLELNIEAGLLTARCTDATTAQFVTQADAIHFTSHKWYHVAVVQAADGAGPKLYVDGVHVASTNDTATDVNEWFNNLDGIDTMRIGAANKAGDDSVTQEFKGFISDVKLWSVALTAAEVLEDYHGASVQAASLQNHWDFDDDYVDNGLGADNGTAVGDVILNNAVSEFTSRMSFTTGTVVVADKIVCFADQGVGHAVVVKAA